MITQFDDNEDGYCVTDEGEPVGYLEMLNSGLVYSFGSSLSTFSVYICTGNHFSIFVYCFTLVFLYFVMFPILF